MLQTTSQYSLPKLSINGSSAKSLEDEYSDALVAIRKARQAVAVCTCHPRDFQFQEPAEYIKARDQRNVILDQLDEIENYLDSWYFNAVEQNPDHNS